MSVFSFRRRIKFFSNALTYNLVDWIILGYSLECVYDSLYASSVLIHDIIDVRNLLSCLSLAASNCKTLWLSETFHLFFIIVLQLVVIKEANQLSLSRL